MKFTLPDFLLLFAMLALPNALFSQCNVGNYCPGGMPEWTQDPASGCVAADEFELDCASGTMPTGPASVQPASWCTTIENNIFYMFEATSAAVVFDVAAFNCQGGQGALQAAILDCDLNFVSDCWGNIPSGTSQPVPSTVPLTPGETYMLMLDGSAGSICDFIINGAVPADPFGLNVCVGGNAGTNVATYTANIAGTWTINPPGAGIITSPNPGATATIEWLEPGNHEVCISVCPNGQSSCLNVEIGENEEIMVGPDLVCVGDMYMCGQTPVFPPGPGVWEFVDVQPNGDCQIVTTCTVNVPTPAFTFVDHAMCVDDFYEVCGNSYNYTGIIEQVCTGPNGCDSVVTTNLVVLNTEVLFEPPIETGCGANWMAIISGLASPEWFNPFAESNELLWTGPGPIATPNDILIEITVPGEYCLTITQEAFGTTCSNTNCIEVLQTLSLPDPPDLVGPTNVCGGMETYTVSPVGITIPEGYTWTTPNGEPYTMQGNFSIVVDWAGSAGGELCVTADNFCGSSDPTCITVVVGSGPATPILDGPTDACAGNTLTYEITNPSPGATCSWTVPPGASFTQAGSTISVDYTGASSGDVCATCMDACGTSPQTCIGVTVNNPPAAPTFTSGPNQVCASDMAQYCINADPNATSWSWTSPAGDFPNSTNTCLDIDWTGLSGGNICVTANNNCGSSPQTCFNVAIIDSPTAEISGQGEFCQGSGDAIDLTINLTGTAPWTVNYSLNNGAPITINNIQSSPYILSVTEAGTYTLVSVTDGGICPGTVGGSAQVIENPLPEAFLSGSGDICLGSGTSVNLLIGLVGEAPWTVVYENGVGTQSTLTINASPFSLPISEGGAGSISLISVTDNNNCVGTVSGSGQVDVLDAPTTSVSTECDAASINYVVTIVIENGDAASYSVTPNTGTLTGNIFTSDPIPSGDGYNFVVTDANNCDPSTVSDDIVVCNCLTAVGIMDQTPLTDCGDGPLDAFIYDNTDENLDGNDVQMYVLHSGNSASIVPPIIAITNDANVSFDPGLGMNYGETYYLSAVVGNGGGAQGIDLDDPCLQVAQGTPVIFYQVPTATIAGSTAICEGESTELTIELTGVSPWTVTLNGNTIDIFGSPYVQVVEPDVTTDYELTMVADANCDNVATGLETITVNTSPEAINITETCNGSGTAFVVEFEITGGDASCYMVTPMNGTLTGNVFTSDEIPDGQGYNYEIFDCNGCPADIIEKDLVDCNCLSTAGNITADNIDVCGDDMAIFNYEGGEFLDADDALCFILHSGNPMAPIATNSNAPEFAFDPATMTIGTTYTVCAAVANDDGSGCVDFDDICLSIGGCAQVTFREIPTALIIDGSNICAGDTGTVAVEFTGAGPWTFEYQDANGTINTLEATNSPFMIDVSPGATTDYSLVSMFGKFCPGTIDGMATVTVNEPPQAAVLSLECNATSTEYTVTLEITGGDPTSYSIVPNNGSLTGNIFTSNPYLDGEDFDFTIDDQFLCGPVLLTGGQICDCVTDAGVMETTLLSYCIGDQMVGAFTTGDTLDGDDNLIYILHTGSTDQLGTIIATNDEPTFDYDDVNMTTGTTYYISAVAGNGLPGGDVDLNDFCLSVAIGTPVFFNDLPEASISGSTTLCNGMTTDVQFDLVGTGPFNIVFEIDGVEQPPVPVPTAGTFTIPTTPGQTVTYSLLSVEDLGTNCSNVADGEIEIIVNEPVEAGSSYGVFEVCQEISSTLSLFENLVGYDYGGTWTDANGIEYPNGALNTDNFDPGSYTFTYTILADAPCTDDSEQVEVIIHPTPVADAGEVVEFDCNLTFVQIGGPNTTPGMSYSWEGNVSDPTIPNPTIDEAGEYVLTVVSPFNCTDVDTVNAFVSNDQPIPVIVTSDITCFGMNDGFIQIESISGGIPPYTCSFNGGPFTEDKLFLNLEADNYQIVIEDAGGCQTVAEFVIIEPEEVSVDLSTDLPVIEGSETNMSQYDSLFQIFVYSNPPFDDLDTAIWTASNNFNDSLLVNNDTLNVALQSQTNFSISISENGCTDEDEITVYVERDHLIYVPNAFSPNSLDDSENETFKLYGGGNVVKVKSFIIFNRWGEIVYDLYNFDITDTEHGWDGTHRGELMNPAVFVWTAEVEFEDNVFRSYKGDVSLLR